MAVYVISYDIYKRVLYLRRYNNILIFSIENKICVHYFKKMSPSFVLLIEIETDNHATHVRYDRVRDMYHFETDNF